MACVATQSPVCPLQPSNQPGNPPCLQQQSENEGYNWGVNETCAVLKGFEGPDYEDLAIEEYLHVLENEVDNIAIPFESRVACRNLPKQGLSTHEVSCYVFYYSCMKTKKADLVTSNCASQGNQTEEDEDETTYIPCQDLTSNSDHSAKETQIGDESVVIIEQEYEEPVPMREVAVEHSRRPKIKDFTIPLMKLRVVRNPFRKKLELEEDEYIFCNKCDKLCVGECLLHGGLKWVKETSTELNEEGLTKARGTLLSSLDLKDSSIPDAGLGIFAKEQFESEVVFGPYRGKKIPLADVAPNMDQSYMWDIIIDGRVNHVVDALDEQSSNWLRFVNCARNEDEQNLVAFQYRGEIYYRSYKTIEPGMEMLVWYGDRYACDLEILNEDESKTQSDGPIQCQKCFIVCSGPLSLASHNKFRCQMNNKHNQWRCMHCDKSFACRSHLNIHKNIHKGLKPYSCKICGKLFSNPSSRRRHCSLHFDQHSRKCEVCGKEFSNRRNLELHERKWHADALKCPTCDRKFTAYRDLRIHRSQCGNNLECVKCHRKYASKKSLRQHRQAYHGGDYFNCSTCDKLFSKKENLLKHEALHKHGKHRNDSLNCTWCGKLFSRKENLLRHEALHNNGRRYRCKYCGKSFPSAVGLANHCRNHLDEGGKHAKVHECARCKTNFSSSRSLRQHYRKFHPTINEKIVAMGQAGGDPCPICNLVYANPYNLARHVRHQHPREKILKCEKCPKIFLDEGRLAAHSSSHTGEGYSVRCAGCNKGYPNNQALLSHVRFCKTKGRHVPQIVKQRLFPCSICKKSFPSASLLQSHKRIHFKDGAQKHFKCASCTSSFTDVVSFSLHKKRGCVNKTVSVAEQNDPTERFKCKQCDLLCTSYWSLCDHVLSHPQTSANKDPGTADSQDSCYALRTLPHCTVEVSNEESVISNKTSSKENQAVRGFGCDMCGKRFSSLLSMRRHRGAHFRKANPTPWFPVENVSTKVVESANSPCTVESSDWLPLPVGDSLSEQSEKSEPSTKVDPVSGSDGMFACPWCPRRFSSLKSMVSHKGIHFRKYHPCKQLRVENTKKICPSLVNRSVSRKISLTCQLCNKSFRSKGSLITHKGHHGRSGQYGLTSSQSSQRLATSAFLKCKVCGKSFLSKKSLHSHMTHHTRNSRSLSGLVSPVKASSKSPPLLPGSRLFGCELCNKSFLTKESLKSHKSHHSRNSLSPSGVKSAVKASSKSPPSLPGNGLFGCEWCDKSFLTKDSLNAHKSHHSRNWCSPSGVTSPVKASSKSPPSLTGSGLYGCELCNKSFPTKASLKSHKSHHSRNSLSPSGVKSAAKASSMSPPSVTGSRLFGCELCGKSFLTKGSLKSHKSHHSRNSCSPSGFTSVKASSKSPSSLNSKMSVVCKICNGLFPSTRSLASHQCIGEQNAPTFQCNVCDKEFVCQTNLVKHKQEQHNNTTSPPHKCQYCGKGFWSKSGRYKHIALFHPRQHKSLDKVSVEKKDNPSYKCQVCSKLFSTVADRFRHTKMKHAVVNSIQNEKYACQHCDMRFFTASGRWKHTRSHHAAIVSSLVPETESWDSRCRNNILQLKCGTKRSLSLSGPGAPGGCKSFQCLHCDKSFERLDDRAKHLKACQGTVATGESECTQSSRMHDAGGVLWMDNAPSEQMVNAFQCNYCDRGFCTMSSRYKHIMIIHAEDFGTRSICLDTDVGSSGVRDSQVSTARRLKYDSCVKGFSTNLKNPRKKVHPRRRASMISPVRCRYCWRRFSCQRDRARHVRVHHGDKVTSLNMLDSTVTDSNLGRSDTSSAGCNNIVNQDQGFVPLLQPKTPSSHHGFEFCARAASSSGSSDANQHLNPESAPSECSDTWNGIPSVIDGTSSLSPSGGLQSKVFQCEYCAKGFFTISARFKHHMLVHSQYQRPTKPGIVRPMAEAKPDVSTAVSSLSPSAGERTKVFQCDYCAKSFFTISARFKHHMLVHSQYQRLTKPGNVYPMVESKTGKSVAVSSLSPSDGVRAKVFQCEYCANDFFTISARYKHFMLIHSQYQRTGKQGDGHPMVESKIDESIECLDDNVKSSPVESPFTLSSGNQHQPNSSVILTFEESGSSSVVQPCNLLSDNLCPLSAHSQQRVKPCKCQICEKSFTINGNCSRHMRRSHNGNAVPGFPHCTGPSRQALQTISSSSPNNKRVESAQNTRFTASQEERVKEVKKTPSHLPSGKLAASLSSECGLRPRVSKKAVAESRTPVVMRYKCDLCRFSSVSKASVLRHKMSLHSQKKHFECRICNLYTMGKDYLTTHECLHFR